MIRSRIRSWLSLAAGGGLTSLLLTACGSGLPAPEEATLSTQAQSLSAPFTLHATGQPVVLNIPQNLDAQTIWSLTPKLGTLVGKGRHGTYTPPSSLNTASTVTLFLTEPSSKGGRQYKLDIQLLVPSFKAQANSTGPAGSSFCAGEGGTCTFPGERTVAYGASGAFVYKTVQGSVDCNNLVFGDPMAGIVKSCFLVDPANITPNPTGFTLCATEGDTCVFQGSATVAFGTNGQFVQQSHQNGVICSPAVFGNPMPGALKTCYLKSNAPVGYTFCALEDQSCTFTGTRQVAYGADDKYIHLTQTDGTACTNAVFGDPIGGVVKGCYLNTTQSTSNIPLLDPSETSDYGLVISSNDERISSIETVPSSIFLTSAGSPVFYVNAFDKNGDYIGRLDPNLYTILQSSGQNLSITPHKNSALKVGIPSEITTHTLKFILKQNSEIASLMQIAVVTPKGDTKVVSDQVVQFPAPGTIISRLTVEQAAAQLSPFTIDDYIAATNRHVSSVGSFSFVLRTTVEFSVGDKIVIPNTASFQGRILEINKISNSQLITVQLLANNDIFQQSNIVPTALPQKIIFGQSDDQFKSQSITFSSTGKPSCETTLAQNTFFNLETEFLPFTQEPEGLTSGFNLTLSATPPIHAGIHFECSIEKVLSKKYMPFGPYISAKYGNEGTLTVDFQMKSTDIKIERKYEYKVNFTTLKPKGEWDNNDDLKSSSLKTGLNGDPEQTSGEVSLDGGPYLVVRPGPAMINDVKDLLCKWRPATCFDPIVARLSAGLSLVTKLTIVNEASAYQLGVNPEVTSGLTAYARAELEGGLMDLLTKVGVPLAQGSFATPLLQAKWEPIKLNKSDVKELSNGSAKLETDWVIPQYVSGIKLGSKSTSVHDDAFPPQGGIESYSVSECVPDDIKAKIIGYGALFTGDDIGGSAIFSDLPFYTEKEVTFCANPKLSDPLPNPLKISAPEGGIAKGSFSFTNTGKIEIPYSIVNTYNLKSSKMSGIAQPGSTETIEVESECAVGQVGKRTAWVYVDTHISRKKVTVEIMCTGYVFKNATYAITQLINNPSGGMQLYELRDNNGNILEAYWWYSGDILIYGAAGTSYYYFRGGAGGLYGTLNVVSFYCRTPRLGNRELEVQKINSCMYAKVVEGLTETLPTVRRLLDENPNGLYEDEKVIDLRVVSDAQFGSASITGDIYYGPR